MQWKENVEKPKMDTIICSSCLSIACRRLCTLIVLWDQGSIAEWTEWTSLVPSSLIPCLLLASDKLLKCSSSRVDPQDELWIGLNDIKIQMYFEWSDGTPVTFTKWLRGEPSHENNRQEDCVVMKGKVRCSADAWRWCREPLFSTLLSVEIDSVVDRHLRCAVQIRFL